MSVESHCQCGWTLLSSCSVSLILSSFYHHRSAASLSGPSFCQRNWLCWHMNHGNTGSKCHGIPNTLHQTSSAAHSSNKTTIYFCPGMLSLLFLCAFTLSGPFSPEVSHNFSEKKILLPLNTRFRSLLVIYIKMGVCLTNIIFQYI